MGMRRTITATAISAAVLLAVLLHVSGTDKFMDSPTDAGTDGSYISLAADDMTEREIEGFIVEDSSLIFPENTESMELSVKIRLASKPVPGRVYRLEDGRIRVDFSEKVMAAAPGQSAVFYDGDVILGGGIISEVIE